MHCLVLHNSFMDVDAHAFFLSLMGLLPPVQPDNLSGSPMTDEAIRAFREAWRALVRARFETAILERDDDGSYTDLVQLQKEKV